VTKEERARLAEQRKLNAANKRKEREAKKEKLEEQKKLNASNKKKTRAKSSKKNLSVDDDDD
jgi:hypothetical protein